MYDANGIPSKVAKGEIGSAWVNSNTASDFLFPLITESVEFIKSTSKATVIVACIPKVSAAGPFSKKSSALFARSSYYKSF
ncbi:MAG: hypothetical protein ABI594_15560 [Ginsengibacter sp.]